MKKKFKLSVFLIFAIIFIFNLSEESIFAGKLIDETRIITPDDLKFLKVPADFRGYFMFQSIEDKSAILIADFVGVEKVITLVIDKGADNTIDSVTEYYPEKNKYKNVKTLSPKFLKNDLGELKKDIIEGTIYQKNYSFNLTNYNVLRNRLREGTDIFHADSGWVVIIYDPETTTTPMLKYFFKLKEERYDLVFETKYYKLYKTSIQPPITFSVYCKNTKDPVVAPYVKELLKMLPPQPDEIDRSN
jgi:hypothetical protein